MKILIRETDYAVRLLVALALTGEKFVSASAMSQELTIPYQFLRLLVQSLAKAKLVETKEGKTGGVRLARDPRKITLLDVVEVFQGEVHMSECLFKSAKCGNFATCVLRARIQKIEESVASQLKAVTVAAMVDDVSEKIKDRFR
jgi:Rrf2 family protein